MKQLLMAGIFLGIALTFSGAGWVLYNSGRVSAGFAVVPMVLTTALLTLYRAYSGRADK